jgi:hypothetical protein
MTERRALTERYGFSRMSVSSLELAFPEEAPGVSPERPPEVRDGGRTAERPPPRTGARRGRWPTRPSSSGSRSSGDRTLSQLAVRRRAWRCLAKASVAISRKRRAAAAAAVSLHLAPCGRPGADLFDAGSSGSPARRRRSRIRFRVFLEDA